MDLERGRGVPGQSNEITEGLQIYCNLYNHAEKRSWTSYREFVLLG